VVVCSAWMKRNVGEALNSEGSTPAGRAVRRHSFSAIAFNDRVRGFKPKYKEAAGCSDGDLERLR